MKKAANALSKGLWWRRLWFADQEKRKNVEVVGENELVFYFNKQINNENERKLEHIRKLGAQYLIH